jgi:hypothetical protein
MEDLNAGVADAAGIEGNMNILVTFEFRAYTRLKLLQHLIQTHQIDGEFFWRPF